MLGCLVHRSVPCAAAVLAAALVLGREARPDFAEIQARGTLRVLASSDEDPAWFAMSAGPTPGFERELLEGFARLHRLTLEIVPVSRWDTVISDLVKGRGDVIAGINDTEARRRQIQFTGEIVPSRHLVVTRKPSRVIRSAEELKAERVGIIPGTTWAEAVAAAGVPAGQAKSYADLAACLEALRSGAITATVTDIADFLLARRKDPDLQDGVTLGGALSGAWAVRKTDPELKRQLDDYLQNLKRTASWGRLVVQYFGEDALRMLGRSHDTP
jgi:ABC-type amino acid transport substrate-binding protein